MTCPWSSNSQMRTNPCCTFLHALTPFASCHSARPNHDPKSSFYMILTTVLFSYPSLFSRYKVGETFLHMPHSRATKRLLHDQSVLDKELSGLEEKKNECEKGMKELKVLLYAKFGKAINLDE